MEPLPLDSSMVAPLHDAGADADPSWLLGGPEIVLLTVLSMGAVFALVTVGLGPLLGGFGPGAVLGAFCAVWSGIGLAAMVAFAQNAARIERHERAAAVFGGPPSR